MNSLQKIKSNERVLRKPEVMSTTGLSSAQLYNLAAKNEFPRPVKLGARASGWLQSEVLEWLETKIANRHHAS